MVQVVIEDGPGSGKAQDGAFTEPPGLVPIAIVGMALRLPGGVRSTETFWEHLVGKTDVSVEVPKDRYNIDAFYSPDRPQTIKTRRGFFLDEDMTTDDPSIGVKMLKLNGPVDPQQRLLLEVVWECMENAGQVGWRGKDIGVFVGTSGDDSFELMTKDPLGTNNSLILGVQDYVLSNRISYEYDLHGPSMTIKTACSAAMMALHEACQSIVSGVCSSDVVAGSSLNLTPSSSVAGSEVMVLSPDGECRTFDASANGYARAEAINAVYIKRLDDAIRDSDSIRAVIRSTMTNCNGATSKITKPSTSSQLDLIRKTYKRAGICNISKTALFEAHGTGTQAGDVAEATAISQAFGGDGVYMTSVKPNFGHSEGASGLTSIIKAVLCLEKKLIPPNMRFKKPNPRIPFEQGKLRVPEELLQWPEGREERVSVNNFGVGGSNAHAILESAQLHSPLPNGSDRFLERSTPKLVVISALNSVSLNERTRILAEYVKSGKARPQDLAYTLTSRRDHERHRAFAVIAGEAIPAKLGDFSQGFAPTLPPSVMFVFTGQGSQWYGMAKELLESFESFRTDVQSLDKVLQSLPKPPSWTLEEKLRSGGDPNKVLKAEYAQPLCAAIQIALVNLLASWNVTPTSVIGHSSGEMAAAYAANVLTAEQTITVAYYRGQATQYCTSGGAMAAVGLGPKAILEFLEAGVVLACENSPQSVVISGEADALSRVLRHIKDRQPETLTTLLDVDVAYHSHMMADIGQHLEDMLGDNAQPRPPQLAMFSTVFGREISEWDEIDASYWRKNLQSPVLFSTAIQEAIKSVPDKTQLCFLEIGPHCSLAGPLRHIFGQLKLKSALRYVSTLSKGQDQVNSILETAGKLFLNGVTINFAAVNIQPGKILTDVPPYPWNYSRKCWVESAVARSWRLRKYSHHELLGSRVTECSDLEPIWRNILRPRDSSWLLDHTVFGVAVYPSAAHIIAIGEAVRQVTGVDTGFEIRNLFIQHALVLDDTNPVEIITTLKPDRLTDTLDSRWYEFKITSRTGDEWTKHCTGQARASLGPEIVDGTPLQSPFARKVGASRWYNYLSKLGLLFGPVFQSMSNITADPMRPRATTSISSGETATNVIATQTTTLDSCLQLITVAARRGISRVADEFELPISFDHISISPCTGPGLSGQAEMDEDEFGGRFYNTVGFSNTRPFIEVRGIRISVLQRDEVLRQKSLPCQIDWKPDIESMPSLRRLLETTRDLSGIQIMEQMLLLVILRIHREISDIRPIEPHLMKHKSWVAARIADAKSGRNSRVQQARHLANLSPNEQEALYADLLTDFVSRKLTSGNEPNYPKSILDRVMHAYQRSVLPENISEKDIAWNECYAALNRPPLDSFLSLLSHSRPAMKILEVGADIGTVTMQMLDNLHAPDGCRTYSKYDYTNLCPSVLVPAKDKLNKYPNMGFRALDITKDPTQQGFDVGTYDLIVCNNVFRTSSNVKQSLENIRRLLVPGGYLVLMELCTEDILSNLIMGLRPDHSWPVESDILLDTTCTPVQRWNEELRSAGFTATDTEAFDAPPPRDSCICMIYRATCMENAAAPISFLYEGTPSEDARAVEKAFFTAGYSVQWFTLEQIPAKHTVISLLDLEEPFFDEICEEKLLSFRNFMAKSTPTSVLWLTRGIQLCCKDPRWGPTLGVARTMRLEFSLPFATFEMDCCDTGTLKALINVYGTIQSSIKSGVQCDYEYAAQNGTVLTSRYYPTTLSCCDGMTNPPPILSQKLTIGTFGMLDTLQWQKFEVKGPGPGEIEVDIKVVGLNFKDIMIAMGFFGKQYELGAEAAGIVRRVGPGSHHQNFREVAVVKAALCVRIPPEMSMRDAATLPVVLTTAIYALLEIGQLSKGQSVLIHSACGGVGLAAIQVCKMQGAKIFATVGNEAKKQYLVDNHDIPMHCIFNSRDMSFKQGILKETRGRGVDLVLNSLSGEGLHASWECVASFGKMIDIGKRDMLGRGKLSMGPFLANKAFFGVDLHHMSVTHPERLTSLFQRMLKHLRSGELKGIQPQTIFDAHNVQDAFRKMQAGHHIGKFLIQMPDNTNELPSLPFKRPLHFDPEAIYLLIGGLGGLGIAISRWMVERGCRNLLFLSRSSATTTRCIDFLKELEVMGCTTTVISGSVSHVDDVQAAVCCSSRRLGGVMQLAMNLKDQKFADITYDEWKRVLEPKVDGTRNIYTILQAHKKSIDFLVVFSSVAGVVGNPGQANYAAANSFLDTFVKTIRQEGFPASVIDLGPVEDIGYISENGSFLKRFRRMTEDLLGEQDVLDAVERAILEAGSVCTGEDHNSGRIIAGLQVASYSAKDGFLGDKRFAAFSQPDPASKDNQAGGDSAIHRWAAAVADDPQVLQQPSAAEFLLNEIGYLIQTYSGEADSVELGEAAGNMAFDSLMAIEMHSWLLKHCCIDIPAIKLAKARNVKGVAELVLQGLKAKYQLEESPPDASMGT